MKKFTLLLLALLSLLSKGEAEGVKRVLLATYPRSGNHWMRHLIEDSVHIITSSVYYNDGPALEKKSWGYAKEQGYKGDCRLPMEGEAIAIKTHFPAHEFTTLDLLPSAGVIMLVRHPIDCIYSYYVYRCKVEKKKCLKKIPSKDVEKYVLRWRVFHNYWKEHQGMLTLKYEDILENPQANLKKVTDYLGYRVAEEDIVRAVEINAPKSRPLQHLSHYTSKDLDFMELKLKDLMKKYGYTIPRKKETIK